MSAANPQSPSHEPRIRDPRIAAERGAFLRSRLASLLAVCPLGVWSVVHIWNNLSAFRGPNEWQVAVTEYPHPIAQLATGIVVLLPLGLHTVWGIGRLFTSRPNNVRYSYYGNLKYLLQRLSALGLLAFMGAHLFMVLKPRFETGNAEPFAHIAEAMHHHTPTLVVYVLGTLALAYHLANGIQTFAMGWGIATSRAALRKVDRFSLIFLIVFLSASWAVIYALYTAGA